METRMLQDLGPQLDSFAITASRRAEVRAVPAPAARPGAPSDRARGEAAQTLAAQMTSAATDCNRMARRLEALLRSAQLRRRCAWQSRDM